MTSMPMDLVGKGLLMWASTDSFYGRISTALGKCLSLSPKNRDLDAALSALKAEPLAETMYVIKSASICLLLIVTRVTTTAEDEDVLLRTSYDVRVPQL
jgi:hypothetical protein